MTLTEMDIIRAAIANAIAEGLDIVDLWQCAEHARTPEDFDHAVNTLVQASPTQPGRAFVGGQWVEIQ